MNVKLISILLAAIAAVAQPICPPINFLNARTIDLSPTGSSHLTLIRQSEGSYTAFEMANASPYAVLRTIPHFEKQFSNCLPRELSTASRVSSTAVPGIVAQPAAFAVLGSGNSIFVSAPLGNSLDVAVFDPRLQFISESQVATLPFGQPPPEGVGVYISMILSDVNGDGKLDLVAQYEFEKHGEAFGGGGVNVLLGDGAGGFQAAGGFPLTGTVNGSMAVGDLNGDGKPDIVVGAPAAPFQNVAGALVVALGKGDGTFVPAVLPSPNVDGPGAIAIADLNGDGKNDLVFLTSPVLPDIYATNEVVVMLGNGDGTFAAETVFSVQVASPGTVVDANDSTPGGIAVGDVNGDGALDIVTNGITILFGDGKGNFPTRRDFLNMARESVILTDFDGDGKMDVVIGAGSPLALSRVLTSAGFYEDTLTVFLGDGTGSFAAAPVAPLSTPDPFAFTSHGDADNIFLASGDFNNDGIADLAVVREFQNLSVFVANSNGALAPVFTYDFSIVAKDASPTSVVVADFNHDGILDLAVSVARFSSPGRIMVFLGIGDGTFLGNN